MAMNSVEIPLHVKECGLQGFIEQMVEEIVLEDRAFDSYKDELQRRCEEAGVDYNNLECDLEDFLENLNMGIKSPDGLAIGMAMAFAMEDAGACFVSQEKIEQITKMWNERHPNQEIHPHNPVDMDDKVFRKGSVMKLKMLVGCEFAPGQRTGFDFDVELTENEMRELAREFLNNEDAYQDFETIKRQHETLYRKIRSCGRDVLDDEMGEDTIKTDIRIAWGDDVEEVFESNFRDEKIYI